MKLSRTIFFIFFVSIALIVLSFFVNADVISVNSGGGYNVVITPGKYIEGFFSQLFPPAVNTTTPANNSNTTTPSGGSTGGQGVDISVTPMSLNINLAVNTNIKKSISVTNLGSSNVTVNISQTNLDGFVILGANNLTLESGQTKNLSVTFVASNQTGSYNGTIHIANKDVPVSLNIKTKLLLFDTNIIVLNPGAAVAQDGTLNTRITLIPMVNNVRTDVTLYYKIEDYNGSTYFTRSETMLVTNLKTFTRNFDLNGIPPGKYIISLKLDYSNGIALSSAQFQIKGKTAAQRTFGLLLFYLVIAIILVSISLIVLMIIRMIRKRKAQRAYLQKIKEKLNKANS